MATCMIYLSTETTPDDPAIAVLDAIAQAPAAFAPIIRAGDPRYDPETHTVHFDADVTIVVPQITIRAREPVAVPPPPPAPRPQRIPSRG
jgi:hypothetical protein